MSSPFYSTQAATLEGSLHRSNGYLLRTYVRTRVGGNDVQVKVINK